MRDHRLVNLYTKLRKVHDNRTLAIRLLSVNQPAYDLIAIVINLNINDPEWETLLRRAADCFFSVSNIRDVVFTSASDRDIFYEIQTALVNAMSVTSS